VFLLLAFGLLLLAASVLTVEVARGGRRAEKGAEAIGSMVVFGLAALSGGALLLALPRSEWLLMIALLPLTTISVIRYLSLLRAVSASRAVVALAALALTAGAWAGTRVLPAPLTRAAIQAAMPGPDPGSALPQAGRLVRT